MVEYIIARDGTKCSIDVAVALWQMLVSVQVVSGCRVVKDSGIHSAAASATIHDVFMALLDGSLDGSAAMELPADLTDNPYQAFIGKSQSVPFQTVIVTVQVGELCELSTWVYSMVPSHV